MPSDGTTELGWYYFGAGNRAYTGLQRYFAPCDQCSMVATKIRFREHTWASTSKRSGVLLKKPHAR